VTAGSIPPAARLDHLVDVLLDARSHPLTAVGVGDLDEPSTTLYLRPLDRVDELLGFDAPASWAVFGVVAAGTAATLGGWSRPQPVEIAHLVHRDGTTTTRLRGPDGDTVPTTGTDGAVPELCRRVLGMATPPPAQPPDVLLDALWLDAVCTAVLARDAGDPPPRWDALASLHPVGGPTVPAPRWGALRRRAALGQLGVPGITKADAAWMDDGMFARWSLSGVPDAADLLVDLRALLPSSLHATLARSLRTTGCDAGAEHTRRPGA
jgi:hypothetical protein